MRWLQRIIGGTPKARLVRPAGDHIENLAAHRDVDIPQIGEVAGLPIWVDLAPEGPTTATYNGLLWEVEPTGEYVYYLAGDFRKNKKGLLATKAPGPWQKFTSVSKTTSFQ